MAINIGSRNEYPTRAIIRTLIAMPVGGGKSVIIGDPQRLKTRALLHAFGRFIDRIGNTYATGTVHTADVDAYAPLRPGAA